MKKLTFAHKIFLILFISTLVFALLVNSSTNNFNLFLNQERTVAFPEGMFRGINMGNSLEAPNEGEWGVVIEEKDFSIISNAGFDLVRIPVKWSGHSNSTSPYSIDTSFFDRVDEVVSQALNEELTVVINMHHYDEIMDDPDGEKPRFLAMWEQIAIHYKDYSSELYFELLNEPEGKLQQNAAKVNELQNAAIEIIRVTNPTRRIVVGGNLWNSHLTLEYLTLPDDENLIATFHYYLPLEFTHQDAEWVDNSEEWSGTTWNGTETEKIRIQSHLDTAVAWSEETGNPLWLGEFGAIEYADMESRARWTSFVAREAEKRNIAWSYWDFNGQFAAYNKSTQSWYPELLEALVPTETSLSMTTTPENKKTSSLMDTKSPNISFLGFHPIIGFSAILLVPLYRLKRKFC